MEITTYNKNFAIKKSLVETTHLLIFLIYMAFLPANAWANSIEQKFISAGLVDIASVDSSIQVSLVNSDPKKNFFRENYYKGLQKAYLRKAVALKISQAQKILKNKYPAYSLQILDAARPRSVSRAMYKKMKGTKFENYVANPAKGSMHNYDIAVDITIIDNNEQELDMGLSPFNKSTLDIYWQFLKMKMGSKLSKKQKENRALLAKVMLRAGFYPLSHEWWHFNGLKKSKSKATI
jgi:D-alanyl-D-alanine dipeptidase